MTGKNTFPILFLNDANIIGAHIMYWCPFEKITYLTTIDTFDPLNGI